MNKQLLIVSDKDLIKAIDLRTLGRKVKELLDYFTERKEAIKNIGTVDLYDLTEEQIRYFGEFRNTVLDAVNILQQMEKSKLLEEIIKRIKDLNANCDIMKE